ncbi:hypothetical protein CDAR_382891 [Caerostris darwini]|uniref:Uncharacterized protein n=1 Tax=Caerostris darwini TaxID=1538125 RepID=A0AAV4SJB3_9ARAC|nr:hypothetical protein CDAR_382891 [Caerostris darwini]
MPESKLDWLFSAWLGLMIYTFIVFDFLEFCSINLIFAALPFTLSKLRNKQINSQPSSCKIPANLIDSPNSTIEEMLVWPTSEQLQNLDTILKPQILHSKKQEINHQKSKLPTIEDLIVLPTSEQLKFADNILKPTSNFQNYNKSLQPILTKTSNQLERKVCKERERRKKNIFVMWIV